MRSFIAGAAVASVLLLASCGSSDSNDASSTTTVAPSTSTTTTADKPAGQLADQYGKRYCEVLTVKLGTESTVAEVWGTQGLNDCPQAGFAAIDPRAVAKEHKATVAMLNGPRYWMLDHIVANELSGSGKMQRFGGLQMRSIATVDLGPGIPDRTPYTERSVNRDTEFSFDEGRRIYELTAPNGSVYVMQSYSNQIDPQLTVDALAGLGDRLKLPAGWTYTSRVLDEQLVVEDLNGVATVIQDELQNSYQLRSRG